MSARSLAAPRGLAAATMAALLGLGGCSAMSRYFEPEPDVEAEIAVFVSQLNAERIRNGCEPLSWEQRVAEIAERHSSDMVRRGYFSHESPEGLSPFDRLRAAGVEYRGAAENIAEGPASGDALFRQWLTSATHRGNMLNCSFTRQGVGRQGDVWTQLLYLPESGRK